MLLPFLQMLVEISTTTAKHLLVGARIYAKSEEDKMIYMEIELWCGVLTGKRITDALLN